MNWSAREGKSVKCFERSKELDTALYTFTSIIYSQQSFMIITKPAQNMTSNAGC